MLTITLNRPKSSGRVEANPRMSKLAPHTTIAVDSGNNSLPNTMLRRDIGWYAWNSAERSMRSLAMAFPPKKASVSTEQTKLKTDAPIQSPR